MSLKNESLGSLVRTNFYIITGGPGSGKTATVSKRVDFILSQLE